MKMEYDLSRLRRRPNPHAIRYSFPDTKEGREKTQAVIKRKIEEQNSRE